MMRQIAILDKNFNPVIFAGYQTLKISVWLRTNNREKAPTGSEGNRSKNPTKSVRLLILLKNSGRLNVDACLPWAVSSAATATIRLRGGGGGSR